MLRRRVLLLIGFFALALVVFCAASSYARADGESPTYMLTQP